MKWTKRKKAKNVLLKVNHDLGGDLTKNSEKNMILFEIILHETVYKEIKMN